MTATQAAAALKAALQSATGRKWSVTTGKDWWRITITAPASRLEGARLSDADRDTLARITEFPHIGESVTIPCEYVRAYIQRAENWK